MSERDGHSMAIGVSLTLARARCACVRPTDEATCCYSMRRRRDHMEIYGDLSFLIYLRLRYRRISLLPRSDDN